jgi:hypothetical protein
MRRLVGGERRRGFRLATSDDADAVGRRVATRILLVDERRGGQRYIERYWAVTALVLERKESGIQDA